MKKDNLSRPTRFGYGKVVSHKIYGTGVVDHEYNKTVDGDEYIEMAMVDFYKDRKVGVAISELKALPFIRGIAWRDPSGEWMCGFNSLSSQLVRFLAFLGMTVYSIFMSIHESPYWSILGIFATGVIATSIYGIYRNWTGKQM